MNDYTFGNFLYELRTEKGLSQAQFGELLGVTNKAVSKWENGSAKPNTKLIPHMAQILGVTVEELFAAKRLEKDAELEKMKAYLAVQRKRYALRSSVALAALITLPMLMAEFICVVMGFGLPDDVAGPLGAMGFILSFTVALVSYFIHRSNFKRLPPSEENTGETSAAGLKVAITVTIILFLMLLLLLPLIYLLILELSYDFLAANIFLSACIFLLVLLLGAIICLVRIKRLLKLDAFDKDARDQRCIPWSERPLWWRILYIAMVVMMPVLLGIQITGLFHGWFWTRLVSIIICFLCIFLLIRKK